MSPQEQLPTLDQLRPVIVRAAANRPPSTFDHEKQLGHGSALRDHANYLHMMEDLQHLEAGILDHASLISGYVPHHHPVEIVVRSKSGQLKAIRRSANIRPNAGTKWQTIAMGGDIPGNFAAQFTASSRSTGSPWTVTSTLSATTGQYTGKLLTMGAGFGVIISHTTGAASVFTLDQWYDPASTSGAVLATPAAGQAIILPGQAPANWLALTNDATQTIDTTATALTAEITTNGLARAFGTYTPTYPSSTAGTTNQGTYTISKQFTATGTQSCQRAAIFNAATSGIMGFLASFVGATLASGDTIAVTWTVND